MHAVVTKQEILVISLTDIFDAASWRHSDVILLPAIRRVSGNDFVPAGQLVHRHTVLRTCNSWTAASTVRILLLCCVFTTVNELRVSTDDDDDDVKKRQTFLRPSFTLWPPNSPVLSPVDYEIWAVMQRRVYRRQIYSVDELKRRLINVWCGLEQSIFDETIDQWRGRDRACVHAKGGHLEYRGTACELTMLILSIHVSVTFRVTCLTVASLIMKSCQYILVHFTR